MLVAYHSLSSVLKAARRLDDSGLLHGAERKRCIPCLGDEHESKAEPTAPAPMTASFIVFGIVRVSGSCMYVVAKGKIKRGSARAMRAEA